MFETLQSNQVKTVQSKLLFLNPIFIGFKLDWVFDQANNQGNETKLFLACRSFFVLTT